MARYDSRVIYQFADHLLEQADRAVITCAILGTLGGALAGLVIGVTIQSLAIPTVALAAIGCAFGAWIGNERAFGLRLQAQTALCQVQIEENTRRALPDGAPSHERHTPRLSHLGR